jgi:hypothetical protein
MKAFSEAEFSAAMEQAVEKRGSNWRFPTDRATRGFYCNGVPTYADEGGNATCLIGAAMQELGMELPQGAAGSALGVLRDAVPIHVQIAARCAQVHQDLGRPWGEALDIYRVVLSLTKRHNQIDAMFGVNVLYYRAVEIVTGPESVERAINVLDEAVKVATAAFEAFTPVFVEEDATKPVTIPFGGIATGGWCTPSESLFSWSDKPLVTVNLPAVPKQAFSVITGGPFKSEHALTA